jgi:hypothetical protein
MPTDIKLKNSVTATNAPTSLQQGEVAINITDKKVWVGNAATTPVQLLGDGGSASFTSIAFGDGTVSAPSITNIGDTNTGIFFPAADTIAFAEGGVEAMRIDSNANLGIGTNSPNNRLQVNGDTNGYFTFVGATTASGYGIFRNSSNTNIGFLGNGAGGAISGGAATDFVIRAETNLLFANAGTEGMRLNSTGNLSIGTTNADIFGRSYSRMLTTSSASGTAAVQINSATGNSAWLELGVNGSRLGVLSASSSITEMGTTTSLPFALYTNSNYRLYITSGGDVGINATSITNNKLLVKGAHVSGGAVVGLQTDQAATGSPIYLGFFNSSNTRIGYVGCDTATNMQLVTAENVPMTFGTNNTERMRLSNGGELAIGKTQASESASTGSGFGFASCSVDPFFSVVNANASGGNACIYLNRRTTGVLISFNTNNGTGATTVGTISHNGTNTAYNTSSDYRLKENILPMTGALAKVSALKPCTYVWKSTGANGQGFIAHELQEMFPDAVTGEKDALDKDGNIAPQSIDTSYLVATLTAAIQEQQAMIETLTTRLNALEGK